MPRHSAEAVVIGKAQPFSKGYPPFLFFSTEVATRGVLEMRQIPQFPFWTPIGRPPRSASSWERCSECEKWLTRLAAKESDRQL